MEGNSKTCNYKVKSYDGSRNIIFSCKECVCTFSFDNCFSEIITAMGDEYNINSIVFKDFMEKKYQDRALDFLILILDILNDLDNFADQKVIKDDCKDCKLNPKELFFIIKQETLNEPVNLFKNFKESLQTIRNKEGCKECIKDRNEDLKILYKKIFKLRKMVLTEGFGIVED